MTADPISCALSAPCATVPGVTCDPTDWGKRVFPAPRAAGGPPDHHGPQYGPDQGVAQVRPTPGRRLKVCATPGCPTLTRTAHCPQHTVHRSGRSTSRRWARLRATMLATHPLCAICGKRPATTVDHITPVSRGGTDAPDNLQPACWPCNQAKGNRTPGG